MYGFHTKTLGAGVYVRSHPCVEQPAVVRKTLGQLVREKRHLMEMTQPQLAALLKINTAKTISDLEKGKHHRLQRLEQMTLLSKFLELPLHVLEDAARYSESLGQLTQIAIPVTLVERVVSRGQDVELGVDEAIASAVRFALANESWRPEPAHGNDK